MSAEVVGYIVTGVVALAGIGGTLWGVRIQTRGQEDIADDDRRQRRLEASYLELLGLVAEADDWAHALYLNWGNHAKGPIPQRPRIFVRTLSSQGPLSAYWSPRMRQRIAELQEEIQTVYRLWLGDIAQDRTGDGTPLPDVVPRLKQFVTAHDRVSEIAAEIRDQVSAELNKTHDGSPARLPRVASPTPPDVTPPAV